MNDRELKEMITRAMPSRETRFAASPQGETILQRIVANDESAPDHSKRRRTTRRRRIVGLTLLATFGAVGAGAVAIADYGAPTAPPSTLPKSAEAFMCASAGLEHMAEVPRGQGESHVAACRRMWPSIFDEDAPDHLFACVKGVPTTASADPQSGVAALVYVVEGGAFVTASQTCGSVGMLVVPDSAG
ncbi:hypothetical protein DFJ67_0545 [Asanoa ferruginea]|uniref:Uncharacterized protein n=1 Tax=Asanoa ferruginea TaxID=53367 RepID=A0A3D9ZB15_9ACTN|nr:hypothetical protein [Asanoa ferruginea]REF94606.1 hypothetical protein DFJ67_0545 [Asanoa ferruginea]GIF50794.1 hypothetical protein Afe04nite_53330 [Asanoa ferruginea]